VAPVALVAHVKVDILHAQVAAPVGDRAKVDTQVAQVAARVLVAAQVVPAAVPAAVPVVRDLAAVQVGSAGHRVVPDAGVVVAIRTSCSLNT
jgi:hypothetical protein